MKIYIIQTLILIPSYWAVMSTQPCGRSMMEPFCKNNNALKMLTLFPKMLEDRDETEWWRNLI